MVTANHVPHGVDLGVGLLRILLQPLLLLLWLLLAVQVYSSHTVSNANRTEAYLTKVLVISQKILHQGIGLVLGIGWLSSAICSSVGRSILRSIWSVCLLTASSLFNQDRLSTCGTRLLAFKPALETANVQAMTTWKLLRSVSLINAGILACLGALSAWLWRVVPWTHLFATDDANVIFSQILGCCVGVASVHVASSIAVTEEVVNAAMERSGSQQNVAHDVDW